MPQQLLKYLSKQSVARLIVACAMAAFALLAFAGIRYSTTKLSDFAGYYGAVHMVFDGRGPAMYDDTTFSTQLTAMGMNEPTMIWYVNPPPAALFVAPVVWLSPFIAKFVWNLLLVLVIFGVWRLGVSILEFRESWKQSIFFFVLGVGIPTLRNFQRGQVYFILLLLVLLLLQGYRKDIPGLTGLGLGGLILLKYFGWMFFILLIARKKWRDVGYTLGVVCAGTLIGLLVFGLQTYQAHIDRLLLSFHDNDQFFTGLPAVQAWFGAMFVSHAQYNPVPLLSFPTIAVPGIFVSAAVLIWWALRRANGNDLRVFCRILALSVMFTPLAAEHHYVLLALPLAVMLIAQIESGTTMSLLLGILATVLVLGWLPAMPIATHPGISKLLCFGRLYGGMLLFIIVTNRETAGQATQEIRSSELHGAAISQNRTG